jgi:predicted DNA-binding antitoxin AbrB/MazE fold protein
MDRRIRYNKTGNGILTSLRNFTMQGGKEVKVELDVNNKKYRILDAVTGTEVANGGNTRNLAVLKIQAKDALLNIGVQFAPENRNRAAAQP